jgi:hypothetical protein
METIFSLDTAARPLPSSVLPNTLGATDWQDARSGEIASFRVLWPKRGEATPADATKNTLMRVATLGVVVVLWAIFYLLFWRPAKGNRRRGN